MSSRTLHIFNPEHDLALAVGTGSYTPPREVRALKKNKSLLPVFYADNGDFILLPKDVGTTEIITLPFFQNVEAKNISLLYPSQLKENFPKISRILPWGWDHAVRNELKDNYCPDELLPTNEQISEIRRLSHRRITIPFRKMIASLLKEDIINLPTEIFSEIEVERYLDTYSISYFKAPWSSSGRGIVVSDHISRKGLLEWAHGVIKKQGSVIAEPAWIRKFDFATEWWIDKGIVNFKGLSVFSTSSRGKYHGNVQISQDEMMKLIKTNASSFSAKIIEAQKKTISILIAPYYDGPLGIDMLSDINGEINPCVEINLRLTMGLISILK